MRSWSHDFKPKTTFSWFFHQATGRLKTKFLDLQQNQIAYERWAPSIVKERRSAEKGRFQLRFVLFEGSRSAKDQKNPRSTSQPPIVERSRRDETKRGFRKGNEVQERKSRIRRISTRERTSESKNSGEIDEVWIFRKWTRTSITCV